MELEDSRKPKRHYALWLAFGFAGVALLGTFVAWAQFIAHIRENPGPLHEFADTGVGSTPSFEGKACKGPLVLSGHEVWLVCRGLPDRPSVLHFDLEARTMQSTGTDSTTVLGLLPHSPGRAYLVFDNGDVTESSNYNRLQGRLDVGETLLGMGLDSNGRLELAVYTRERRVIEFIEPARSPRPPDHPLGPVQRRQLALDPSLPANLRFESAFLGTDGWEVLASGEASPRKVEFFRLREHGASERIHELDGREWTESMLSDHGRGFTFNRGLTIPPVTARFFEGGLEPVDPRLAGNPGEYANRLDHPIRRYRDDRTGLRALITADRGDAAFLDGRWFTLETSTRNVRVSDEITTSPIVVNALFSDSLMLLPNPSGGFYLFDPGRGVGQLNPGLERTDARSTIDRLDEEGLIRFGNPDRFLTLWGLLLGFPLLAAIFVTLAQFIRGARATPWAVIVSACVWLPLAFYYRAEFDNIVTML